MRDANPGERWIPVDPKWVACLAGLLTNSPDPLLVKYAQELYQALLWMHADTFDQHYIQAARDEVGMYSPISIDDNAVVLLDEGGRWVQAWVFVEVGEVDFPRGCLDCDLKGYLWPMASDGDESRKWIERCDSCGTYEDDYAAAEAMVAEGYEVGIAMHPRGRPQPHSTGKRKDIGNE